MIDIEQAEREMDEQIERLLSGSADLRTEWVGRIGLFAFMGNADRDNCGCVTMIKGSGYDSDWPDLTQQIINDHLISGWPSENNTRPQLERFKHYQLERIRRTNAMEAQP